MKTRVITRSLTRNITKTLPFSQEAVAFNPAAMQYHPDKSFSTAALETSPSGIIFNPAMTEICIS